MERENGKADHFATAEGDNWTPVLFDILLSLLLVCGSIIVEEQSGFWWRQRLFA